MKNIHFISLIIVGLLFLACDNDFAEINQDPNRIAEISLGTLLNPIIYGLADHNSDRSWTVTFDLMQVSLPFPSVSGGLHRYDVSNAAGNSSYYWYYRWLNNISEMQEAAEKAEDNNYLAIALTFKALCFANLTDIFGPLPMEEASLGEEDILYPTFDSQQDIYEQILADLERANTLYDTAEPMIYSQTSFLPMISKNGRSSQMHFICGYCSGSPTVPKPMPSKNWPI